MLDMKECFLCNDEFPHRETAEEYVSACMEHAGYVPSQPAGWAVDEALSEVGMTSRDDLCIACWIDKIHPVAWKYSE